MIYQDDYSNFLLRLDQVKNRMIYAKITALNFQELPIETIEGRITQGSINIDGTSAIRRTCSLSMVAQDFNYSDYVWGLNTKFKLEIGVENTIDLNYPSIIWFPQGIYILTSMNTSRGVSNFTISLQGKDKMCLLNGEVGGVLESSVDFGTIEEENRKGEWTIRKLTLPEIIRNAVHTYGGEPYHNIIINDLDTYGLELLEYRYDAPMYMYRKNNSEQYSNILMESDCLVLYDENNNQLFLKDLKPEHLESLTDSFISGDNSKLLYTEKNRQGQAWKFTKINYGQTAGYRLTDLTYAGDLIANIGESLTSVLDKIKNMLTEFEYFYNLEGQFVFQKKQSFISTMWSPSNTKDENGQYESLTSSTAYTFTNNNSIISFNNNPNLGNMKNDYTIWGERNSASGAKIPIHLRYAIDTKVQQYTQIFVTEEEIAPYNNKYGTLLSAQMEPKTFIAATEYKDRGNIVECDWREILYQMAVDYFKYNHLDNFELKVAAANPSLYPTGQTGYEQYYTDIQGFWRQLFYPNVNEKIDELTVKINTSQNIVNTYNSILQDKIDNNGIKTPGLISSISAFAKLINDFKNANSADQDSQLRTFTDKMSNLKAKYSVQCSHISWNNNSSKETIIAAAESMLLALQTYYKETESFLAAEKIVLEDLTILLENTKTNAENFYGSADEHPHWCKDVFEAPDALNFWFDFLDQDGELEQFNVKVVGSRSKAINDTTVKSIYFRETPPVIFQESTDEIQHLGGFKTVQIGNIEQMFSISAQGKSAKNRLDELLYTHGYCIESATITAIPIYYLQPNIRIHLNDEKTHLNGDYIVSKITLPLSYNGTMSITATKAADNLL